MAKVLDALARAQQERQQRQQGGASPEPVGVGGAGESTARLDPEKPISRPPLVLRSNTEINDSAPGNFPAVSDVVIGAHDAFSPIAEQVRQIRTNLDTVLAEYDTRPLVVTSPVSGDGKSLFSANLAWTLADNPQQRVLLIDADLRKPDQYRVFGIRRAPGLSEVLRGQSSLDQAIIKTGLPNFDILPSGRTAGKPTAILSTDRLPALIEELRSQYTWILFDTPPLLPVTDATIIGRLCVGLILVVRMGKTQRELISRAQDLLAENRLPVLGCVLNEFESPSRAHDYYHKYYVSQERAGGDQ